MGNRALIVFHDTHQYSPTVYLHWDAFRLPTLLKEWWGYMEGRRNDVDYGVARFIGICHDAINGNTSLGVSNIDELFYHKNESERREYWEHESPGDAGVFIVNVSNGSVERIDGSWSECNAPETFIIDQFTVPE